MNRFGVIPKNSNEPGWRLILDLSHPHGFSVNDGIDPELCRTQYCKFDDAIKILVELGPGALMAKTDIKSAYRIIPVHPRDRYLLGMKWEDRFYVDLALPFGLRSAPFIFNSVADMLAYILSHNHAIRRLIHYLDDYFTADCPRSDECLTNLTQFKAVCAQLGIPLAPDKCIGPTTCLVFLGIELDSVEQSARLPTNKLKELKALVAQWLTKTSCTKSELESFVGKLQHASLVVRHGRTFLRRLFNALSGLRQKHHCFRLSRACKQDIAWWGALLAEWNGVSFYERTHWEVIPDVKIASDASGKLGYGVTYNELWFNGSWNKDQLGLSIAYKELFPIVLACVLWGEGWRKKRVQFECDNESVVAILRNGTSKNEQIMNLIRHLFIVTTQCNFSISAIHVPGKSNGIADALSRFRLQEFFKLVPTASPQPVPIPTDILQRLTLPISEPRP